ncbi:6-phosphofructokinase [Kistimonas scapharcae]|uniref:ATP-dependent 6-phosphofructokinase n=1 Tax=Kistimonas scapharcae TaxID=1036133 RepID=A0ABP8V839_9GAMM
MERPIKHIGLLTSGGDAPGMNAAIRAVVCACEHYNISVTGIKAGYQGLINGWFTSLDSHSLIHSLCRGGTLLKSARCQAFRTQEGRAQAWQNLQQSGIDALVVIGGDGSLTGAALLEQEYPVAVIGIPATIDNDIFGTDACIGYDTATNTVVEAIDKIHDTAASHNRLFFIEVMGRNSGFIALNAGIAAGCSAILVPEHYQPVDDIIERFASCDMAGDAGIVIVAEGHQNGGIAELASITARRLPDFDIRVSILGHIQRGGSPSCADRVLAGRLGVYAIEQLRRGESGTMVALQHQLVCSLPLHDVIQQQPALQTEQLRVSRILAM